MKFFLKISFRITDPQSNIFFNVDESLWRTPEYDASVRNIRNILKWMDEKDSNPAESYEQAPVVTPMLSQLSQSSSTDNETDNTPVISQLPNYDASATGNLKDDAYQADLQAYQQYMQQQQAYSNQPTPQKSHVFTNDDFFVRSQNPIVAGSISGKVIGTQLITGGGGAVLEPVAAYLKDRDRLQNTILQMMKPVKPEDVKFETPKIPNVDGRYATQFKKIYQDGLQGFLDIAGKYGNAGYKSLNDQKTKLGQDFKRWQDNMEFITKNINDVTKQADLYSKIAQEKGLMTDPRVRKKLENVINGTTELMYGKNPNFNLSEELNGLRNGITIASVVKDVKSNYIAPINTEFEKLKNLNPKSDEYKDVIQVITTKLGLDGGEFFPEGVTIKNATKEQLKEAQMKKAEELAKPILLQDWGTIQQNGDVTIDSEILKQTAKSIYEQMNASEVTKTIQGLGERESKININNSNTTTTQGRTPFPGNIVSHVQNMANTGYNVVGKSDGSKSVSFVTPSGAIGIIGTDKEGNQIGQASFYNPSNTKSFLTNYINRLYGNTEDAMRQIDDISNNQERFDSYKSLTDQATNSKQTYQAFLKEKKVIKPQEQTSLQNYSLYSEKVGMTIPVADRIATKFHYMGVDQQTGKIDKRIYFTDTDGNIFVPSPLSINSNSDNFVKYGDNTSSTTLSKLPKTTLSNAYYKINTDGVTATIMKEDNKPLGVGAVVRISDIQAYMNSMFMERAPIVEKTIPTTNKPYTPTQTSKKKQEATEVEP